MTRNHPLMELHCPLGGSPCHRWRQRCGRLHLHWSRPLQCSFPCAHQAGGPTLWRRRGHHRVPVLHRCIGPHPSLPPSQRHQTALGGLAAAWLSRTLSRTPHLSPTTQPPRHHAVQRWTARAQCGPLATPGRELRRRRVQQKASEASLPATANSSRRDRHPFGRERHPSSRERHPSSRERHPSSRERRPSSPGESIGPDRSCH